MLENFQVAGFQAWLFYFLPLQFSILWSLCVYVRMIFHHQLYKTFNNERERVARLLIQNTISDSKVYLSKNYLANIIIECLNFTTKPPKIFRSKTLGTYRFAENNKRWECAGHHTHNWAKAKWNVIKFLLIVFLRFDVELCWVIIFFMWMSSRYFD